MYDDPLAVQESPFQVIPNPSQEQVADLAGQWRNWMANPNNRSALMQFGVSLMQPMGFGQNAAGHVGQAIGSVGELGSRRSAEALRERDLASKEELRASQAQVAEARAATAGSGAARAADRLQFQRERLDADLRNQGTRLKLSALLRYQQARKAHEQSEDNAALQNPRFQRTPFPSPEQWAAQNGIGDLLPSSAAEDESVVSPQAAPSGNAPQIGEVRQGYRFRGGNPASPQSWEKVR